MSFSPISSARSTTVHGTRFAKRSSKKTPRTSAVELRVIVGAAAVGVFSVFIAWAWPLTAHADSLLELPSARKGSIGGTDDEPGPLALVAEMSAIAVLGVERNSVFPGIDGIKGNEPELGIMRLGLIGVGEGWPVKFSTRFDLSETDRITADQFRDHPFAVVDQLIDDFYARWEPRVWAGVIAGRQKVPFSVFRHLEHSLLTAAAPPFLIDRVAPDRRWGVTAFGDLGSLSYALGGFEDVEQLEPRLGEDDPSAGGRAAIATHVQWTPRAPMGKTHVATPRTDPWYDTLKVSAGAGALYRIRESGNRLDGSLSGRLKWMHLAAVAELILSYDDGQLSLDAAGEASTLFVDRAYLFVRGDYDVSIEVWSAGTGIAYYVTKDRLNKLTFVAFVRRDTNNGPPLDAIVLQLQALL